MRGFDRRELVAAGLLLAAASALRLALGTPVPPDGDSRRFLSQARDLVGGSRDLVTGDPFSTVPPGYPLFIRAAGRIRPGIPFLLRLQFALSLGTCLLAWLAARRRSRDAALAALALLALNPWLARQQALVMSETLGAFLVALTVFLWPAPGRPLGGGTAFALGALGVTASLVTPAAAFVAAATLAVLAGQNRRRPATVGLMAAGVALVMVPWQALLLRETGRIEPSLLHPARTGTAGITTWLRTWSRWPQDKAVWWSLEARTGLPEEALGPEPERSRVLAALAEAPYSHAAYVVGSRYDVALEEVGRARIRAHPFRARVGLPLIRSVTLWLDYRSMIGIPAAYRHATGVLRAAFWGTHAAFWGLNLLTLALFGWGAVQAIRRRDALLIAVVAGAAAYTLVSAATARGEYRRNLTLQPALVLLLTAIPAGRRPEEARA